MTARVAVPLSARLLWIGHDGCTGPEHAIRLLPPLLETLPDAELIVVGGAADRSTARHLANDLRIADRVTLPDPADDQVSLLRSASLLLVTGDPDDAREAINLAAAHGLRSLACSPSAGEMTASRQGIAGPYIVRAREIIRLLRDDAAAASPIPAMMTPASRVDSRRADGAPRRSSRGLGWRAVKRRGRRVRDGGHRLLVSADPRRIPDRLVRSAAAVFDRAPQPGLVPIQTLDFSSLGLGDTLMAWAGLHALLHGGYRPVAPGCTMRVQDALVRTGTALFASHGLRVVAATHGSMRMASPILSPRTPQTWRELYRSIAGPDWYMNCFPAIDAQKAPLRADFRRDPWERLCLGLTERLLYRRRGWQAAPADYVGFRLWMPIARQLGFFPVNFLALFKQSLPHLRTQMRAWAKESGRVAAAAAVAIFPSGRSYQAFPPDFCRRLGDRLQLDSAVFYVAADDPWIDAYRDAGLNMVHLDTVEDLLSVVLAAFSLVTTDSFASHAAQLMRDDFMLVLTRDIRENVLHPGANPQIISQHPRCAPCHYVPRVDLTSCPARYDRCVAFENDALLDRIARIGHQAVAAL